MFAFAALLSALVSAASLEFCQRRGHGVILVFLPSRVCEEGRGGGIVTVSPLRKLRTVASAELCNLLL